MIPYSIIIFLLLSSMLLNIYFLIQFRYLQKLNSNIIQVINGNSLRKFHYQSIDPTVTSLYVNLNKLVSVIAETRRNKAKFELERKEFIVNISHDLRTPLASMIGYTEALKDPEISQGKKKKYVDIIINKTLHLSQLLQRFFELSKLEYRGIERQFKKINIGEVVEEEILSFYHEFQKLELEPTICLPEEPVYVEGDKISLKRILSNLISNSLTYGRESKTIGVSVNKIDTAVWVSVWDEGPGIPKKDLPFIFDSLYTGDHARNNTIKGNGIGLTIVKKLVDMHKGKITVESQPYKKTKFSFSLPLKD